jgi:hypothetical protein
MHAKTHVKVGIGDHRRLGGAPMKVKTHVRAGGIRLYNHNETLVHDTGKVKVLKVKTHVRAGGIRLYNHNETLMADTLRRR